MLVLFAVSYNRFKVKEAELRKLANKYEVAKYLLENGADPNSCDANGITILMDTIRAQNTQIVKLLLNYGANPNLQQINGQNAYHEAAYMGRKESPYDMLYLGQNFAYVFSPDVLKPRSENDGDST